MILYHGLPTVHIQPIACAVLDFVQINFDTIYGNFDTFSANVMELFSAKNSIMIG